MGTKSRVRKKNGKPVKYKPKPQGISKTKMKKIMEMIQEQQKNINSSDNSVQETREDSADLLISPDFTKKINISSDPEIDGPQLSSEEEDKSSENNTI